MESWQRELQQSIRTPEELRTLFSWLTEGDIDAQQLFPVSITPHTIKLVKNADPSNPLVRMCLPSAQECVVSDHEREDPLCEKNHTPVPGLLHRYSDRVLLLVTSACAQHCRFCFRRCLKSTMTQGTDIPSAIKYLHAHPEVKEVILSGGDPLMLTDDLLESWCQTLCEVPTIERLRIHTRIPVVLPSRITPSFLEQCHRMHTKLPLTIVTHFNHPKELAQENRLILERLQGTGITLKNQSVLLRGVNDDATTLITLFQSLSTLGVENYYLHQLDPACGTRHFYVPIEKGKELMTQIRSQYPSLQLPRYVADIPSLGGKKDLEQEEVVEESPGVYRLSSFAHLLR
ncbi:MAG: L-lysine 2,3-aminomutase [Candidatus Uhrbacteria bacterium GW2011_GWE2_46_68]|uniref:L-lysine 2,3-aminomutase n=2 Tax=Candidatus Uhriibacteriota TaxID=1752732 RepID=A0A0G1Q650_9BACT|nr:MAG: L-lysine 2,3-aminomutase [Candidatus Uhrbacteria bacterium GW2011_GWF2_46_218]KKU40479.1 MAG: L-lysine 2,3-aminomutase [Candidatus Uhrbacteria bacterium GW2011_GWE2_46_68]